MEKIRGNGAREDDSARACRSLNEAERDERFNIPGENAEYGRDDECGDGGDERTPPSVFIAHGTYEKLPCGESYHARRDSELHQGYRGAEKFRHRREAREVHVRHERRECGEESEDEHQITVRIAITFDH